MYAIVEIGGHQYKVAKGDVLFVDRQNAEANKKLTLDRVLMVADGKGKFSVGTPVLEKAAVEATVVDHVRGDKVIVFKKKRRKGYQKTRGHRADLTQIQIDTITA